MCIFSTKPSNSVKFSSVLVHDPVFNTTRFFFFFFEILVCLFDPILFCFLITERKKKKSWKAELQIFRYSMRENGNYVNSRGFNPKLKKKNCPLFLFTDTLGGANFLCRSPFETNVALVVNFEFLSAKHPRFYWSHCNASLYRTALSD